MPERILVVTVGGSPTPILQAIEQIDPSFVSFIASTTSAREITVATVERSEVACAECDKKLPRSVDAPSIVAKAGLTPAQYEVTTLPDPDDFDAVVTVAVERLRALEATFPGAEITCNYTGGTKSMTAGLVTAALEHGGVTLSLVTGHRTDAIAVRGKASKNRSVSVLNLALRRTIGEAARLFDRHEFASAQALLEDFTNREQLDGERVRYVDRRWRLCLGFDAWDRFDHGDAFDTLREFATPLGATFQDLLRVSGRGKTTGYEGVFDLVRNAERRAERARFDDAVARLYRAVESLAQVRLRHHRIDTGDVPHAALSDAARARFASRLTNPKLQLGLHDAFWLLGDLNDPLGAAYQAAEYDLRDALQKRNGSILAHGATPMDEAAYEQLHAAVERLLAGAAAGGIDLGAPLRPFPKFADVPLD